MLRVAVCTCSLASSVCLAYCECVYCVNPSAERLPLWVSSLLFNWELFLSVSTNTHKRREREVHAVCSGPETAPGLKHPAEFTTLPKLTAHCTDHYFYLLFFLFFYLSVVSSIHFFSLCSSPPFPLLALLVSKSFVLLLHGAVLSREHFWKLFSLLSSKLTLTFGAGEGNRLKIDWYACCVGFKSNSKMPILCSVGRLTARIESCLLWPFQILNLWITNPSLCSFSQRKCNLSSF